MTSNDTSAADLSSPTTPPEGFASPATVADQGTVADSADTAAFLSHESDASASTSDSTPTGLSADAAHSAAPADPADTVWTASGLESASQEPAGRRTVRTATVTWGLILAFLGGLLVAIGLGARIDLVVTGIILLAGLGVALLILALLPRRSRPDPA